MKPIPDAPTTLDECRPRFIALVGRLIEKLELRGNWDIRDEVAALALIERVLAREKPDDDASRAGSKVKQFEQAFKATNGDRWGAGGTGADVGQPARGYPGQPGAGEDAPEPTAA